MLLDLQRAWQEASHPKPERLPFLLVQRTSHRTQMLGKLMKLVSDRCWARSHVPMSGFNVCSSIPGIPFIHMYRGLDLAGWDAVGNSAFLKGHTFSLMNLFTGWSHILFHQLYQGLGHIRGRVRVPSCFAVTIWNLVKQTFNLFQPVINIHFLLKNSGENMGKIFLVMYSFNVHLFIKFCSHTLLETPERQRLCFLCYKCFVFIISFNSHNPMKPLVL